MAQLTTALRRLLWLLLLLAAGTGAYLWWRERNAPPEPPEPPTWPPLDRTPETADTSAAESATAAAPQSSSAELAPSPTQATARSWAAPGDDGSCPEGYPVKAKESSGIFHLPGGRFYDRTNPDRCYADAAAAEADGYRRSKT